MDPMTAMALMQMGQGLMSQFQPQVGPPAPAPQMGPPVGGLLGSSDGITRRISQVTGSDQMGPPTAEQDAAAGLTDPTAGGGFGAFFNNLNGNLSTPAGQLGLGLLGQAGGGAALPVAGLLGMGLFGKNKVF